MIGGPQFLSHMAWLAHPDRLGETETYAAEPPAVDNDQADPDGP